MGLRYIRDVKRPTREYLTTSYGAIPLTAITRAVQSFSTADQLDSALTAIMDGWSIAIRDERDALQLILTDLLSSAAEDGANAAVQMWFDEFGLGKFAGVDDEGIFKNLFREVAPRGIRANLFKNIGNLITDLDETTVKRVRQIISQGIKRGDTADQIAASLSTFIDDDQLTDERAQLIAQTEVNNVLSQAALEANLAMGADEKAWVTVGDDRVSQTICAPNEGDGEIPIKDTHQSGHLHPSGHPRCRCTEVYFGVDVKKLRGL
jgi:SPP1 gp7 family putative phage head morphogenesis protein